MIYKDIESISESDLLLLKQDKIIESKTIEYKKELHIEQDAEKKEFLRDVCSFSNAEGGDLIIGIEEKDGFPIRIDGIEIEDVDSFKQRIDHIILAGIEPNISYSIKPVKLQNKNKYVLIIRIEKNSNGPHRVCYKGEFRFYSRNSSGKYFLDIAEIKTAFNSSYRVYKEIKEFREERISRIYSDNRINQYDFEYINEEPNLVMHLIPLNAFSVSNYYDLTKLNDKILFDYLRPFNIKKADLQGRWNADGYLSYFKNDIYSSYVQLYRNGIIEIVGKPIWKKNDNNKMLINIDNEILIKYNLENYYLPMLEKINVKSPIVIGISFLGVDNFYMDISHLSNKVKDIYNISNTSPYALDRDILILKENIVYNFEDNISLVLKPSLDILWNAFGIKKDLNYIK